MTALTTPTVNEPTRKRAASAASEAKKRLASPWASLAAIVIAVLWTIPTFGLLITSIRPPLAVRQSGWWTWFTNPEFTWENYDEVLFGSTTNLSTYFVNSLVITIPSVLIPLSLATLAAYAFAWTNFRGRDVLFVAVFALQIVPLQIALLPLLTRFVDWNLNGTFWPVWISHSIFALPLAIFLLHNFMREIPGELVEAARVDGAGHVRIFLQIMLPLLVPVDRSVRHLPVPLGVERPARRADDGRWLARRCAVDGAPGRAFRHPRHVVAPAVCRRVRLDRRAARRVPLITALLRSRPARGQRQRVIGTAIDARRVMRLEHVHPRLLSLDLPRIQHGIAVGEVTGSRLGRYRHRACRTGWAGP